MLACFYLDVSSTINCFVFFLQDPNYVLGDPVAANVAVMDKKDNYVSVVTSLNTWFGSKVNANFDFSHSRKRIIELCCET